jgi:excisionase family DNA binding protein
MENKLYTTEDVADYFHVRVETIREWVKEGILPALKVGKSYLYTQQDINTYVAALRAAAQEKRRTLEEKYPGLHDALEKEEDMWVSAGHANQWEAAKMKILDVLEGNQDLYWRWEPGIGIVFTNRPTADNEAPQFDITVTQHRSSKK